MAEIRKGIVTQVVKDGAAAVIRPYGAGTALMPQLPTQRIIVPGQDAASSTTIYHPQLATGDPVAFVLFEDGTGLIIDKA